MEGESEKEEEEREGNVKGGRVRRDIEREGE